MMENINNKASICDFFQRFSAADVQGAISLRDDRFICYIMRGEGGLPMSGEMNKEGMADLIGVVRDAFPHRETK